MITEEEIKKRYPTLLDSHERIYQLEKEMNYHCGMVENYDKQLKTAMNRAANAEYKLERLQKEIDSVRDNQKRPSERVSSSNQPKP